ncbi:hypothetical protein V9T40_003109 [Parthenolecanium corni]|uniref:Uncharacterized protein n=1 Tax=Parthenolecanium corni TaxID=536013 RepID=A0AAN9YA48_9HEMI
MGNKSSRDALEGRGAVVTGANSGIGLVVTKKLLEYGMVIVSIDGETDKLDALKAEDKNKEFLHVVQSDITDEEEVLDAFQWVSDNIENVDVLINCAEIIEPCSILGGDRDTWQKMANYNIIGFCACSVEMIRTMKDQKIDLGLIVNINSVASHEVASSSTYHFYSATKHAALRLTEHLRQELEFTVQPIKMTSITVGPNEFFASDEGYINEVCEVKGSLRLDDITSAIDYVIHTPSHLQVRDLVILPMKVM